MNSTTTNPRIAAKNQKKRAWLPYVGGVLLLGLIGAGFWPKPAPVETTLLAAGPLRTTVSEEGRTRIRQRYVVSAPVMGHVRRIDFKVGSRIESTNMVVAVIDPVRPTLLDARSRHLAEARRESVMAKLESARARHRFQSRELARVQALHREKTVSVQELERAEWGETAAARELAVAESGLKEVEAELAEFGILDSKEVERPPVMVRAPSVGQVLKVYEESSRTVAVGAPLLEVGDSGDLEVIIEVLSRDAAMIQPGTDVELEQWGGKVPLNAKVRLVEPRAFTKVSALGVEEQRVYVVADLLTPTSERKNLGDQFRVEARIITWQSAKVLKAPAGALFRMGDRWACYVLSNGRSVLRTVRVGHSSGVETEILEGLKEGEEVILYPGDRVKDGTRVRSIKV